MGCLPQSPSFLPVSSHVPPTSSSASLAWECTFSSHLQVPQAEHLKKISQQKQLLFPTYQSCQWIRLAISLGWTLIRRSFILRETVLSLAFVEMTYINNMHTLAKQFAQSYFLLLLYVPWERISPRLQTTPCVWAGPTALTRHTSPAGLQVPGHKNSLPRSSSTRVDTSVTYEASQIT